MIGHIKINTYLTGHISESKSGGSSANSDHIFAQLKSEQSIIVTISDILPFKYTDIDTTEG